MSAPGSDATGPNPPPTPGETPGVAFRRAFTACLLLVLAFVFLRTMAVEPFGVPTGSMAPALIGNHREVPCPRCGHPVVVGEPSGERPPNLYIDACCPNCGKRAIDLSGAWEIPGDRLMVDKNVFNARSPRRWEVAVFRCPVDNSKPYVKRIIGRPGEAIQIVDGDVFANGQRLRKTLADVRQTWLPVFDSGYTPSTGWGPRWLIEPLADDPKLPAEATKSPPLPGVDTVLVDGDLLLDATGDRPPFGVTYRHVNPDDKLEHPVTDWLSYNGPPRRGKAQPVHDFILVCDLEVRSGDGRFACRLGDGADTVAAEFPVGGDSSLLGVQLGRGGGDPPVPSTVRLETGKTYHLEFAFVDRRAMLALNGTDVFVGLDLHPDPPGKRSGVSRPVQFGVRGAAVVVRNLKLYRDIHYRADGPNGTAVPYQLGADEYFVLGDNSGNSFDSREWKVPAVREGDFIGKPFVIHQPLKAGRVTVNGVDKAFQTVDWSRLRWVR